MKQIKKEILIAAPPAKVWEHITDPKKLAAWLMPNDFEPLVGKEFVMHCQHAETVSCVVKEIVPLQKLVYSFRTAETKAATLVTITLAKEDKNTRLTLIHSGWEALPPDQQGAAGNFEEGWGDFLKKLQQALSATQTN
jgi:uncharacterized protein YndB with AHSA1/START domain